MDPLQKLSPGDRKISANTWNHYAGTAVKLESVRFSEDFHTFNDGGGLQVALAASPSDDNDPFHFEVITDPDFTTSGLERRVAIRGGICRLHRYDSAFRTSDLTIGSGGEFTGTGPSTSQLASTSVTIPDGAVRFVNLLLRSTSAQGEVARANELNGYLSSSRNRESSTSYQPGAYKMLARVENTGGVLDIKHEYEGGNYTWHGLVPDSMDKVWTSSTQVNAFIGFDRFKRLTVRNSDNSSTLHGMTLACRVDDAGYDTGRRAQWEYPVLITSRALPIGSDKYFDRMEEVKHTGTTSVTSTSLRYVTLFYGTMHVGESSAPLPGHLYIDKSQTPLGSGIDIWQYVKAASEIGNVINHVDLGDMPSSSNTGHDGRYWIKGSTFANCFGQSIGVGSAGTSSSVMVIDLVNRTLDNGTWTVTAISGDPSWANRTLSSFQTPSGSAYFDKGVQVNGAGTGGVWFASDEYLWDNSGSVRLSGAAALEVEAADVKITSAAGDYYHDSKQGWTGTFQALQNGNTVDVEVSGGIIVNVT